MHDLDVRTEGLAQGVRRMPRHRTETRQDLRPYRHRGLMILALAVAGWSMVWALYYVIRLYL